MDPTLLPFVTNSKANNSSFTGLYNGVAFLRLGVWCQIHKVLLQDRDRDAGLQYTKLQRS
jgi:hypothetical protein